MRNVPPRQLFSIDLLFLGIDGDGDVGYTTICKGRPARQVRDVFHMAGAHDPRIVDGDVHENFVEFDILLSVRLKQIVILQPGNRKYGLSV